MMKMLYLAACAAALTATPALAQQEITSRPSIVVVGSGGAERAPDTFHVSAEVEGRGATQVEALRALAEARERVGEGLARLEGLERAQVTTDAVRVEPTHGPGCGRDDYGEPVDCPIAGYRAAMSLTLEGAPVERAGDAVSLAAERGARNARMQSTSLRDSSVLQAEANAAAFADARRQADALAQASGQRIVRVLRVQDPGSRPFGLSIADTQDIVVTGMRVQPTVSLSIAPPRVRIDARLTVVFEIE